MTVTTKKKLSIIPVQDMLIKDIRKRGLKASTCKKYGYFVTKDEWGNSIQIANYVADAEVVFQKSRDKDKNFIVRGHKAHVFWGQQLFQGGKKLVITEGEIDCLTVSQVQGNKYPVVSLPFGCKSALDTFKANIDWLKGFEEVIVMFDMDEVGQKAVQSVVGLLPPHKLKIAQLPLKDPNECLIAGKADAIINAIWNAKEYRPDGLVNAKDLKDVLFSSEETQETFEYPWSPELNKMTMGIRKGEMVLLTAGSGIGKSTMAREIAYKLKMKDGLKVGLVMLEENPKKTLKDILSIHCQLPLHLLWNTLDKKLLETMYDKVFGDGNFVLYDHFGSIEGGNLLDKIRYLITGEGCDYAIFDHVSIAVSGLDESSGDERKCIDRLMTNLRALIEETGAGIVVVSHLRKSDMKATPFEQGGIISLDDLRGSGSLKQLPDIVLALERNQQADDESLKNTLKLRVLKNRFTGNTGIAGYVRFNKSKNILEDVDPLEIKENKGEEAGCQF
ncbi:DnaB-like helicase C-terminal domain-containing protein [Pectinatus frisingensis]|uniref:DnaB-like helicase C-terminal domain-containing protein n=1 Tax=Pectinatus frisingensis TaxID=865 RepID=UPI0018C76A7A